MSFKHYRRSGGYSEKSIRVQDSHVNRFLHWCTAQRIDPELIIYDHVLSYIDHERTRGLERQSIIQAVNSIRIYYDYLLYTGVVSVNVIRRIKLQQAGRRALPEILSPEQLEKLYEGFKNLPEWQHRSERAKLLHQRDTVVLGLLIYQGLNSGQMAILETSNINLEKGNIYIPSSRKGNARILSLHPAQVLATKTYLDQTRPQLLQMQQQSSEPDEGAGERENERTDPNPYLVLVKKPGDMVSRIIRQVKQIDPSVTDSRQIRSSVIMNWLKSYNIRQVQYMAGHRNIRTTEYYRRQDLSDLAHQLELFHPLR
jgi:integrase/recombinase XerD